MKNRGGQREYWGVVWNDESLRCNPDTLDKVIYTKYSKH